MKEGGHNIPKNVIRRRYEKGLKNFFTIFRELVDDWMFIDNSGELYQIIAEGAKEDDEIRNTEIWNQFLDLKRIKANKVFTRTQIIYPNNTLKKNINK